jgi:hypothetical protein
MRRTIEEIRSFRTHNKRHKDRHLPDAGAGAREGAATIWAPTTLDVTVDKTKGARRTTESTRGFCIRGNEVSVYERFCTRNKAALEVEMCMRLRELSPSIRIR